MSAANKWGDPSPETENKWNTSERTDDGSLDSYGTDEDESDDEYAPIQFSAWGSQENSDQSDPNTIHMPNTQDNKDVAPTVNLGDWRKLCDPNVVVKSGIGSGNLHRKGKNYIPLDEQHILNQRLKVPGALPGKKKKRGSSKKGKSANSAPPSFHPSIALRPVPKPVPSVNRRPPLSQSAWGNSQLSSTPFWEQSEATTGGPGSFASKYAPKPSTPAQPVKPVAAPPAPVRAAPPPAPISRLPPSRSGTASNWANKPLQENPVVPPSQPKTTHSVPRSQSVPATKPVATTARLGSAASRYASPQSLSSPAAQAPARTASQPASEPVTQQASAPLPTPPTAVHGTISLNSSVRSQPTRKTIFQLNIELTPGINAILPVYETDDYTVLVREFGVQHHLMIAPDAEFTFAEKIKQMVAELHRQQAAQQQEQT